MWGILRKAPSLPFLSKDMHGTGVLIVVPFYAGDIEDGKELIAPTRTYRTPIADAVGPHPYAGFQQAFDPLLAEGARNYWQSHNFEALTDEAIDTAIDYAGRFPSAQSEILVGQVGRAMRRVPVAATAYPHRDVEYVMNVHTRWEDTAHARRAPKWAQAFFDAMAPHATGGTYVHFISES